VAVVRCPVAALAPGANTTISVTVRADVGLESNSPEDYPAVTVPFKRC
jgi:hypothetical protein